MGYPTAMNTPSLSGILIPTLWAKQHIVYFYQQTYWKDIANTDYVGEITSYGDQGVIPQLPSITIRPYVNGQDLQYESPAPNKVTFYVDHGFYWAFTINQVDMKQSIVEYVGKWAQHSAKLLNIQIERDILANVYSSASAYNKGATAGLLSGSINLGVSGTPLAATSATILAAILSAGQALDEQDCPEDDRYIILPAWGITNLKSSELRQAYLTGDDKSTYRTGKVGGVDRFTVYLSNLLYSVADGSGKKAWHCIAGQKSALTFATQITENEEMKNPKGFGTLHRGLQVYGYKVTKPEAMVDLYISQT